MLAVVADEQTRMDDGVSRLPNGQGKVFPENSGRGKEACWKRDESCSVHQERHRLLCNFGKGTEGVEDAAVD